MVSKVIAMKWDFESCGITRPVLTSGGLYCSSREAVAVLRKASGFPCTLGRYALLGALC